MNWREEIEALAKGALGDDGQTVVDDGMGIGYSAGSEEARKDILRLLRVIGEVEAALVEIREESWRMPVRGLPPTGYDIINKRADRAIDFIARGSDEQSQSPGGTK